MKILITGGTGLIGRALCSSLSGDHDITVYSRQPEKVSQLCGSSVKSIGSLEEWQADDEYNAVINLAGEPIIGRRWSENRKAILRESRIALTNNIVEKIAAARHKPKVMLSASAIGYYGNTENAEVTESSPPQNDFGSQMCMAWENAAIQTTNSGVRVCTLRTGLVLSGRGGMLQQMLLPFKCALGARIGNGRQWMSWIHIDDEINAIKFLLENQNCQGPFNLTAPKPVTNRQFTRALARTVSRPAFLFAPAFVLKLLLGESSALLLGGQKVLPEKLLQQGFQFKYNSLSEALIHIVAKAKKHLREE